VFFSVIFDRKCIKEYAIIYWLRERPVRSGRRNGILNVKTSDGKYLFC
jgi:hypothetical protein